MTKKVISALDNLEKLPKGIIRYGILLAVALLIAGIITYVYNQHGGSWLSAIEGNALYAIQVAVGIFAEAIIGGLVTDYLLKKRQG